MKQKRLQWFLAACCILLVSACSQHWKSVETEFDNHCWSVTDTLELGFESSDTASVYELSFPITLNEDYPFHNIYLHVILTAPSGDQSTIPTEFVLADRNGAWLSEPSGDVIPFLLKVPEGIRFNQAGKYSLRVLHFMRDGELCGVESAGIALDPMQDAE